MGEVVNLRNARKQAARKAARARADENAVRFGRTAAQKAREAQDTARARAELDGKRIGHEASDE
ncbi:MAG: DUF4169 family protein [Paracoccaceae bacterium]|nr:MAG: DUF4169 family protein [Paracoccaceae bacterium]